MRCSWLSPKPTATCVPGLLRKRLLSNSLSRRSATVAAAKNMLHASGFDESAEGESSRWSMLDSAAQLQYGVHGEMPLVGIAQVLLQPAVRAVCTASPSPSFVDFGSGAGRLLLGVAAMAEWESYVGIEAVEALHAIACASIDSAEASNALDHGMVTSLHAGGLPHEAPAFEVMATADCVFMYSTAFPSEDGLRLPELSASLACVLKEDSIVVTTDSFLIGERFKFEELVPVQGPHSSPIHCFVWRVVGAPEPSYDATYDVVMGQWMGSDPAERNEGAYVAMLKELQAWSTSQNRRVWPGVTAPPRRHGGCPD